MIEEIPLGLYIHFPWCIQKCPYCDFNSHELKTALSENEYVSALLDDLDRDLLTLAESRPLTSLFMGGGTPSLFSPRAIDDLLVGIRQRLTLPDDVEITMEANPGTFEAEKFAEFRAVGINRLSIGVQSFNDAMLEKLGRVHNGDEAERAVALASHVGFDNLNVDLMFGLPESRFADAVDDLKRAMALQPTHISYYQLTLEPNTYFYKFPPSLPSHEQIYRIQQQGHALLAEQGFKQYEISAFSVADRQCRHNLNYWQFGDYLGIGAGAHGKITRALPDAIQRYWKFKHPQQYLAGRKSGRYNADLHSISVTELPLEFIMNHLRLKSGFPGSRFVNRTGLPLTMLQTQLAECRRLGLLQVHDNHVTTTEKGWDFLDRVLAEFMT